MHGDIGLLLAHRECWAPVPALMPVHLPDKIGFLECEAFQDWVVNAVWGTLLSRELQNFVIRNIGINTLPRKSQKKWRSNTDKAAINKPS